MIDDNHCDRIHSAVIAVCCCGKAASGLKRILCGLLVKKRRESMNRCTGRRYITEAMFKTTSYTIHSLIHHYSQV